MEESSLILSDVSPPVVCNIHAFHLVSLSPKCIWNDNSSCPITSSNVIVYIIRLYVYTYLGLSLAQTTWKRNLSCLITSSKLMAYIPLHLLYNQIVGTCVCSFSCVMPTHIIGCLSHIQLETGTEVAQALTISSICLFFCGIMDRHIFPFSLTCIKTLQQSSLPRTQLMM